LAFLEDEKLDEDE